MHLSTKPKRTTEHFNPFQSINTITLNPISIPKGVFTQINIDFFCVNLRKLLCFFTDVAFEYRVSCFFPSYFVCVNAALVCIYELLVNKLLYILFYLKESKIRYEN